MADDARRADDRSPPLGAERLRRRWLLLLLLGLVGCGFFAAPPTPIPFGGPRASILASELAYVRAHVSFALREPTWVPAGFSLFNVSANDASGTAVDLWYQDGSTGYVHIWQTRLGPEVTGIDAAAVTTASDWPAFRLGPNRIELRGRVDGVTISVDGSVGEADLRHVIASLGVTAHPSPGA